MRHEACDRIGPVRPVSPVRPSRTARIARGLSAQAAGHQAERRVAEVYRARGCEILAQCWRGRAGEIDLILRDGSALVFVEVKYRSGRGWGEPLEAVTHAKVRRLAALALLWLREHPQRVEQIRVDAIGVLRVPGQRHRITHARGITR